MAKRIAKADLPTKVCQTCGRPFAWRRKWSKVWTEVRYCSDACRSRRGPQASPDRPGQEAVPPEPTK